MNSDDRIIELLQTADAATGVPPTPPDLPARVRTRRARHAASRRVKYAALASSAAVGLAAFILLRPAAPPPTAYRLPPTAAASPPTAYRLPPTAATLLAEADALAAEADQLQRQVNRMRTQDSRLALLDECRTLAAQATDESPLDRTAIIALCRGDMLWQDYQARDAAAEAWQSVIQHYPDTHWATMAHARIAELPPMY